MNKILLLIQVISFITYMTYVIYNFGILKSISESYYKLSRAGKFLFTLFIWSISIPMAMYGTALFFWSGACLSFVGAATMFKDDTMTKKVHYIGAFLGFTLALVALSFVGIYYPLLCGMIIVAVCVEYNPPNKIFWIETLIGAFLIAGLTQFVFK
jgi:hypothetical protein